VFYYFIIVSCFHLSLASWLLFSNKVQFSSVQCAKCAVNITRFVISNGYQLRRSLYWADIAIVPKFTGGIFIQYVYSDTFYDVQYATCWWCRFGLVVTRWT